MTAPTDQVPQWTAEDEAALRRRVTAAGQGNTAVGEVQAVDLRRRPRAGTTITVAADLAIVKRKRATCPLCRKRRVMLAIVVAGEYAFGGSEPRCAPCWGLRP
jgi:hypothetical protein